MKIKTIPSSWINRIGRRLDSGPYISDGLEYRMRLDRLALCKNRLVEVTENGTEGIFIAPYFKRNYIDDPQHGVPLLGNTHILMSDPLLTAPLIPKKTYDQFRQGLQLKAGWTLITCFGTVGNMAYCRPDMETCAGSTNFMRVVPDANKIASGYLYAFLSSKFGRALITQSETGSVIPNLLPSHIADLPVPRLGAAVEQRVHALVEEATSLLTYYQRNILTATNTFFAAVGLKDITNAEWHAAGPDLGFSQTFPCVDSLRALNFNPRYKRLCDQIKAGPWRPLGEICLSGTLKRGGRYKRIDAEPQFSYQLVGQKQLFWLKPEGRWIAKTSVGDDVLVEPGTILVAAQGTLGESELYCRAEFAWSAGVDLAYSEHILRVLANEEVMPRGCLFAFMRSETAFRMFRSISVGTKLQDHHHVFRAQIPIPYPTVEIQNEVNQMVINAYEARHQAIALENEAIHLVEQAIEEAT